MKRVIIALTAAVVVLLSMSSCEEESKTYEVKALNECFNQISLMGVASPLLKIRLDEVLFNDKVVATDIAAPTFYGGRTESDYFQVESGIDYEVKVKYTTFNYNATTKGWDAGVSDVYVSGTESWTATETSTKFAIKFTSKLLNAYQPKFETFTVD